MRALWRGASWWSRRLASSLAARMPTRPHRPPRLVRCTLPVGTSRASASVCFCAAGALRSPAGLSRTCRRMQASASAGTRFEAPGATCTPRPNAGRPTPVAIGDRVDTYPAWTSNASTARPIRACSPMPARWRRARTRTMRSRRRMRSPGAGSAKSRGMPSSAGSSASLVASLRTLGVVADVRARCTRCSTCSPALHGPDPAERVVDGELRAALLALSPTGSRGRAADGLVRPVER